MGANIGLADIPTTVLLAIQICSRPTEHLNRVVDALIDSPTEESSLGDRRIGCDLHWLGL